MSRRGLLVLAGLATLLWACPAPAWAALNLKIVDVDFPTRFDPGEVVPFNVTVRNNEATAQFIEVDISLTSLASAAELTLVPVLTRTVAAGGQVVLSASYGTNGSDSPIRSAATDAIPLGMYTVVFTLVDGNGLVSDKLRAKYPLRVGTETESLRVFPEAINLGTLPPGRHAYPTPIEVRWSYFRFNRLRQDQPFSIRIYTDNAARYHGIPHALRKSSPAGLVSMDGRYTVTLKSWGLNFGPDIQETGWDSALAGPPPVDDDDIWRGPKLIEGGRNYGSATWVRIPDLVDMTPNPVTWRRMIGQDPYDDRFVSDLNPTGDFTLKSPFTFYLATETGPTSVEGSYSANLVVELWTP